MASTSRDFITYPDAEAPATAPPVTQNPYRFPVNTQTAPGRQKKQLSKSLSTPADSDVVVSSMGGTTTSTGRRNVRSTTTTSGRPQLTRAQSIRDAAATFFGVPAPKPTTLVATPTGLQPKPTIDLAELDHSNKWKARRLRHCSRMYGPVRDPPLEQQYSPAIGGLDDWTDMAGQLPETLSRDPRTLNRYFSGQPPSTPAQTPGTVDRSSSTDSRGSKIRVLQRRESVAKMAWDGLSTLVVKGSLRPKKPHVSSTLRRRRQHSRSFSPGSILVSGGVGDDSVFEASTSRQLPASADAYSHTIPFGGGSFGGSAPLSAGAKYAGAPFFADSMAPISEESGGDVSGGAARLAQPCRGNLRKISEMHESVERDDEEADISQVLPDLLGHQLEGPSTPPYVSSREGSTYSGSRSLVEKAEASEHDYDQVARDHADSVPRDQLKSQDVSDGLQRSYLAQANSLLSQEGSTSLQDDVFFDLTLPTAPPHRMLSAGSVLDQQRDQPPLAPVPPLIGHKYHRKAAPPSHGHHRHQHHLQTHHHPHRHEHHIPSDLIGPVTADDLPTTAYIRPDHLPLSGQAVVLPGRRPYEYPPVPRQRDLDPSEPYPGIRFVGGDTGSGEPDVPFGHPGAYQRVAPDRPAIPEELKPAERHLRGVRRVKQRTKEKRGERPSSEPWTLSNLFSKALFLGNSDRRRFGEGALGKIFGRTLKKKSEMEPHVRQQLSDAEDFRPYFTYWVTTVQILVALLSVMIYGFGPIGFGRRERTANVLHSTVTLEQVAIFEQENFWIGPRFADLVHLGAKFAPCMRHDLNVYEQIESDRKIENTTGCCIYHDETGCFQSTEANCPELIATHSRWSRRSRGPGGRISGSVCGQDPRACNEPPSVDPFTWPDDLTRWPICTSLPDMASQLPHMRCEITGRPCCIQLNGQCRITTREYCDFVNGYFHEEATLCSQVSCLKEVCGMLPFLRKDRPDQFYRLFISIFIHAGLIHCMLSVLLQYYFMRDLEKLVGCARIALVYLCSGIAGNLASAVFVPYKAEVGPAGSQFGLLASLFVDAIYSWYMIVHPWKAVGQLSVVTFLLFLLGLLPWVDNWAHMFGFIFGLLLSLATFPYIQFDQHDRTKRIIIIVVSLVSSIGLFALLIIMFYVSPLWDCNWCQYFNCIPFTEHFCDNQGLRLDNWLPI